MVNIKQRSKGVQKKKKLSRIICHIVVFIALAALISILYLCRELSHITNRYSQLLTVERSTSDILGELESQIYRHQSFLIEHTFSSSPEEKKKLEEKSDLLKSSMNSILRDLRSEMKDTKFDIRYRSLSYNILGYLTDADSVFELSRNGRSSEVKELMESSIIEYINSVNFNLESFENLLNEDINTSKSILEVQTRSVYLRAIAMTIVLLLLGILGIIMSVRVVGEITNIDPLTLVPNYDYFRDFCSRKKIQKNFSDYSVMSVNIKGFQYFNQQYGTEFGDEVLTQFAGYLNKASKKDEIVSRVNGDTFVLLIKKDRVSALADYLSELPLDIHQKNGTTKSIVKSRCGVFDIIAGTSVEEAVDNSRTALKEAKKLSKSDCVWYDEKMSEDEKSSKETVTKFNDAIKNEEFVVYYQPKVNMSDNRLCGCEALVRWIKDGKMIPPFSFIPVLEDEGYITQLDFYVFEHVCQDIAGWKSAGIKPVRVSSNFSKLHLKNKKFADDVLDIIEKYQIDKEYIEIELTESSGYEDFDAMTEFVTRMKSENIYTAIDDFGTGYSSLSMLKDLDIDVVKLDKSFLSGAEDDAHKKMIENVVKMINDLHRKVICEGVETEQQAGFLKSVECFLAQGYLYDKPLPHDDFEQRLINPVYVLESSEEQ